MPSLVAPAALALASPLTMLDDKARIEYERDRQRALKKNDIQKAKQRALRPNKADTNKPASAPSRTTVRQDAKRSQALDDKDSDLEDLTLELDDLALQDSEDLHYTVVEEREFIFADFVVERPLPRREAVSSPSSADISLIDPSLGFHGAHGWFITEARDGCAHLTTPPPTYSIVTLLKREW